MIHAKPLSANTSINTKFLLALLALTLFATGCDQSVSQMDAPASAQIVSDPKPGKQLNAVSRHSGEENHEPHATIHEDATAIVSLTTDQIEAAGIGLAQAASGVIRETLPLYGVIAFNATNVREVTARFPGVIAEIKKEVGDNVQRDETLVVVESDESLQRYEIASPLAGTVVRRSAHPGEHADNDPLMTVANLDTVWVEMALFSGDLGKVHVGQSALVRNTTTGLTATGKVVYVAPVSNLRSQAVTARVLLDNTNGQWPPGLHIAADVILGSRSAPVTITEAAVQRLEGRTIVFVRSGEGFEPTEVQLGRTDGETVEVLAGLAAGESYATTNSFVLKAELGKGDAEHSH